MFFTITCDILFLVMFQIPWNLKILLLKLDSFISVSDYRSMMVFQSLVICFNALINLQMIFPYMDWKSNVTHWWWAQWGPTQMQNNVGSLMNLSTCWSYCNWWFMSNTFHSVYDQHWMTFCLSLWYATIQQLLPSILDQICVIDNEITFASNSDKWDHNFI